MQNYGSKYIRRIIGVWFERLLSIQLMYWLIMSRADYIETMGSCRTAGGAQVPC